jgi:hypothetical protein
MDVISLISMEGEPGDGSNFAVDKSLSQGGGKNSCRRKGLTEESPIRKWCPDLRSKLS